MTTIYTIDASVFMNAYNEFEVAHAQSHELLERLRLQAAPLIEPTLLLPEVAAALARVYKDEALATEFAQQLKQLPHLSLVAVDEGIADLAVQVASRYRLRGSDAVYAAVAQRYNTTLVTLDGEQEERIADIVTTRTPDQALADLEEQDEA